MTEQRIHSVDAGGLQAPLLDWAAKALAQGDLVVAPTETRYALMARADDSAAMDKLFQVKGRPAGAPVAVFVGGVMALYKYAVMTAKSEALAERFLPGPLLLVLKAATDNGLPVVNDGWIGLRVSSSNVIQSLVRSSPFPLSATSANKSGSPEVETIGQVHDAFGDEIALYFDAGPLLGPVSTVVRCDRDKVEILREGAVSEGDIMTTLEQVR